MPKCEIFNLMDSRDFYTIKPSWVGDFGTKIKISKLFRFFSAEHALTIFVLRARSK
jgi:hypothetical protein